MQLVSNFDLLIKFCFRRPLHLAAAKGSQAVLQLLMMSKAQVNVVDNEGATPLHKVPLNGTLDNLLTVYYSNCSFQAVQNEHETCAKMLLAAKPNLDVLDARGLSCLHYAVKLRWKVGVKLLLDSGVNVNIANKVACFNFSKCVHAFDYYMN